MQFYLLSFERTQNNLRKQHHKCKIDQLYSFNLDIFLFIMIQILYIIFQTLIHRKFQALSYFWSSLEQISIFELHRIGNYNNITQHKASEQQIQMDEEQRNELEATKSSFYKLQDNFNHNLLVIEQLEEELARVSKQNQRIKAHHMNDTEQLHSKLEELHDQNNQLRQMIKVEVEQARVKCEEETERIVGMMNEKMMSEKRYEEKKWARERKDMQSEITKYQETIKHYSLQNSKLTDLSKQLRQEKESLDEQLANLSTQKQTYSNKFALHEKELENMRAANQQWEALLKQKLKQANRDKQKLEQELSQIKLGFKLKLKSVKDQAAKKIQQIQSNKERNLRLLTQQAKQIKFRFDANYQQLQKLRVEHKNMQKQNQKLQQAVQQLSKQAGSQKQIEYLKKMQEQQRIQLKNQNKLLENQRNQLKEELKEINQRREEVEKSVQRLKTALLASQKQMGDAEKKNKKLEREMKQFRAEAKRIAETTNINFRGYDKFSNNDDLVNESPAANQQNNIDYSKYFSEDMGPADEMFFMQNSGGRSPKNIAPHTTGPSPVNHQLMKKIGQLQVETDSYKNLIKSMKDQMEMIRNNFQTQLAMKDQEIKLGRDEVYLLRQKINQREQQLLSLNSVRQQIEDRNKSIKQLKQNIEILQSGHAQKNKQIQKLTDQLKINQQKNKQLTEKYAYTEQEKNMLDQINEELRAEIHQFKNRIKLYNQSEEQGEEDIGQFQDMQLDQSGSNRNISEVIRKDQQIKRKSKSKSRSKSGKKFHRPVVQNRDMQLSGTSMKLKDLVMKKKQLQMEGKKIQMDFKQQNSYKNIEKTGTVSQKQILQNIKRKAQSKSKQKDNKKEKDKVEKLRKLYNRQRGQRGQRGEREINQAEQDQYNSGSLQNI